MLVAYGYGYGMYRMYFDWTYLLIIAGVILSLAASSRVKSTFNRFAAIPTVQGMTGAQAAERILRQAGIYDVSIVHVSGQLTDNYNPGNKTLSLSDSTYSSTSVAAIGVAAHECGHAIQHQTGYVPIKIRSAIVPVTNIGATLSFPLVIIGILMGGNSLLINIGILLFTFVVVFHLVTLPVEYNASNRALQILSSTGMLQGGENDGAKKVLSAAALTYVASAATMILQLLRLLILANNNRRNR